MLHRRRNRCRGRGALERSNRYRQWRSFLPSLQERGDAVQTLATQDRNLFSALPKDLSERLFAKAQQLRVTAGRALFVAGETGDGCYRVDQGLLKVSALSASGGERILAI